LDADDFIPRTVARELVRIASPCDDVIGAESYLIEYMSKLPPDGWRSRPWGTQIVAAVEGARIYPWFVAESARAMQIRLWKGVHTPRDGALIYVRGNEAIYRGPLLWLPECIEVSSPKGVILPKYSPLVIPNSLTFGDTRLRAEVHLGAIGLRAGPLVEALRRDFGGLADRAVKQLQEQGLLPAALPDSSNSPVSPASGPRRTKRPGTLESQYQAALGKHVEGKRRGKHLEGKGKAEWAKEMEELHGWNVSSVQTWLARPEIDELWRGFGGLPTSPKMRGTRRPNG
jgi:hypothetical protein